MYRDWSHSGWKRSVTVGSISGGYTDVCMRNKRSSVVVSTTEPSGDLDI